MKQDDKKKSNVFTALADKTKTATVKESDIEKIQPNLKQIKSEGWRKAIVKNKEKTNDNVLSTLPNRHTGYKISQNPADFTDQEKLKVNKSNQKRVNKILGY